ncbi:MAG: cell division protein ZapE [Oceanospirillales bacterium]|uniref:Cell division protein ZapE n=1 Tax=Marinobacterium halophilum TaxID=267374 RepID=A0A2P8F122_9GAMM|nr:cell division protein ZapE [Marinobacterium halophilum]MBR9829866.1 cell division protein ZapE [Oceanospirillales bacterium]PSL15411.1 cell division protein ZapE [Marinobacterium halophilum]
MTPLERYQQDLKRDDFSYDPTQEMAVGHLQRLYDDLVAAERAPKPGLMQRLGGKFKGTRQEPISGLYFWGGVGRGKTYLMDTFYDSLPFERKMRTHFHRFMQRVHSELKALDGTKNPLVEIGRKYADEARIICFDEFFVSDITDAMILGGLMQELFNNGVSLVATSNIVPDGLYKDGLQRQRFLPAIDMLKRYTQVVNVDGGVDYRLRTLEQAELYHWPLDAAADQSLAQSFESLAPDLEEEQREASVEINGRLINARRVCEDVAWFDFDHLCQGARSQNDYIELGKIYHAILLGNVPQLGRKNDDAARRFINLVDEFYDSGVKLIISAEVPIHEIYTEGRLGFEIERTQSRLLEMQSHEYLAREHRAG